MDHVVAKFASAIGELPKLCEKISILMQVHVPGRVAIVVAPWIDPFSVAPEAN